MIYLIDEASLVENMYTFPLVAAYNCDKGIGQDIPRCDILIPKFDFPCDAVDANSAYCAQIEAIPPSAIIQFIRRYTSAMDVGLLCLRETHNFAQRRVLWHWLYTGGYLVKECV